MNLSRFQPIWILLNVIVTTFLAILSAITTIIANQSIQGELALTDPQAEWVTTFYLLGINTTVPVASWFAKRFGFKTIYSVGVLLFTIGTALAGCAPSFLVLALGRALEGIGAGFIFPVGLALIAQHVSSQRLSLALNFYIGCGFAGGLGAGLPIAGYLSEFWSWRIVFLGMLPLNLIAWLSCWYVHKERKEKEHLPFDVWGFVFFSLFIGTLLTALTFGPLLSTNDGWVNPWIVLCLCIAVLSLFGTFWIEKRHPMPLFPMLLFKNIHFILGAATLFLLGMAFFGSVSVAMQYMIDGLHYEKYIAGKIGMIYGMTMGIMSIVTSLLMRWIPIPLLTLSGLSLVIYSYFLNNSLDWQTGPDQVLWILFLRGVGVGLGLGPTTSGALKTVSPALANDAATLLTFFRQVGGTYGGTLIAIVSIKRTIYHATRFSEQANTQLPAYQVVYQKALDRFFPVSGAESAVQAQEVLRAHLEKQAFIQGLNDAFLIFGYVIGTLAFIVLCLNLWQWFKTRSISQNLSQNS